MCTLRVDALDSWMRVFDFSKSADEDSITAGAIDYSQDLHFTIFRARKSASVHAPKFFKLGQEFTMLCTVSEKGRMRVFKDGLLVGENAKGHCPLPTDRPHLTVGSHYQFRGQHLRGTIRNVKVWDCEVSWPAAERVKSQAKAAVERLRSAQAAALASLRLPGRAAVGDLTAAQKVGARNFAGIMVAYGVACAAVGTACVSGPGFDRVGKPMFHAGLLCLAVSLLCAALALTGIRTYARLSVPIGAVLFILAFLVSLIRAALALSGMQRRVPPRLVGAGFAYAALSVGGYLTTKWNFSTSGVVSNEGKKGKAIPIPKENT